MIGLPPTTQHTAPSANKGTTPTHIRPLLYNNMTMWQNVQQREVALKEEIFNVQQMGTISIYKGKQRSMETQAMQSNYY